jgi:signal transduction histidine kinase
MSSAFNTYERGGLNQRLDPGRDRLRLEALGLMTAGIVHDLGNMIQVLSSAVSILNRHPIVRDADGLQPVVADAVHSLERATALVGLISGFGRPGTAGEEDVDIILCLASLERLLRWVAAGQVSLDLSLPPNCPRVTCNRRSFENAVLNLVLNARDAMPDGGKLRIVADARLDDAHPASVLVSVIDTGGGMAPETLARAFEPFFTTKPGGSGAGLGLPMVRRFAQEAGGRVVVRSSLGLGTTITLELPAASEPITPA